MYRSRQPAYRQQPPRPAPQRQRRQRTRTAAILLGAAAIIIIVGAIWLIRSRHSTSSTPQTTTTKTPAHALGGATEQNTSDFNKGSHSTTDPASIWIVVNKKHPLSPKNYAPANLVVPSIPLRSNITSTEKYVRSDMAKALEKMVAEAAAQNVHFNLQSGYRSYSFQVTLYNGYVQSQGQAVADRQSARPGYSEHQTGLAADLGGTSQPSCNVEQCFADTVEGKWLAANAYKYGFLIRYTSDKEQTTGYEYEPWHIRYIDTDLSNELHTKGVETLEEFFGIAGGNYE